MVGQVKQGRNEPCACGSGKKFKRCCGVVVPKGLTLRVMMKCLYVLLQGAAEGNLAIPMGPIPFSRKLLNEVPNDLVKKILVAEVDGCLVLTVKPKKKPLIVVPKKPRLVV